MKIAIQTVGEAKEIGISKGKKQRVAMKNVRLLIDGVEYQIYDLLAYAVNPIAEGTGEALPPTAVVKSSPEAASVQSAVKNTVQRRAAKPAADAPPSPTVDKTVTLEARVAGLEKGISEILAHLTK